MGQWPRSVVGGATRTTGVGRHHRHPAQTDSLKSIYLEGAGPVAGIGYQAVPGSGMITIVVGGHCCTWEHQGQGEQQPQLLHYGPILVHIFVVSAQNTLFWSNTKETRRFAPSNPKMLLRAVGSHDKNTCCPAIHRCFCVSRTAVEVYSGFDGVPPNTHKLVCVCWLCADTEV